MPPVRHGVNAMDEVRLDVGYAVDHGERFEVVAMGQPKVTFRVQNGAGVTVETPHRARGRVQSCSFTYDSPTGPLLTCSTRSANFSFEPNFSVGFGPQGQVRQFLSLCHWLACRGVDVQVNRRLDPVTYRDDVSSCDVFDDSVFAIRATRDAEYEVTFTGQTQVFVKITRPSSTVQDVFGFKVEKYSQEGGGTQSKIVKMYSSTSSRPCYIELTFDGELTTTAELLLRMLGESGANYVAAALLVDGQLSGLRFV